MCGLDPRVAAVIRIDALWVAVEPMDMRAGADRLLARVVQVFGAAQVHHGYLFANARSSRIKLLVHDGFGVWCAARRLNAGRFVWPVAAGVAPSLMLTAAQFDALVLGLLVDVGQHLRCEVGQIAWAERLQVLAFDRMQIEHAALCKPVAAIPLGVYRIATKARFERESTFA